jgi:hypothetical protein
VYVVWLPMLAADSRGEVDEDVLADPRVTQFWDEDRLVGRWLAETGLGEQISAGVVWDAYYLFGPEATWNERPGPLLGFGAPVIANTGSLENAVATVLGEQRNRAS